MNMRSRILLIVMDFWQAGAQRYAYEIDSSLNKDKFEVTILSLRNLNTSQDFEDYYYPKHKELGSNIAFVSDIFGSTTLFARSKRKLLSGINKNLSLNRKLTSFINQFDVVNWIGEYTFSSICNRLNDLNYEKSIIHI